MGLRALCPHWVSALPARPCCCQGSAESAYLVSTRGIGQSRRIVLPPPEFTLFLLALSFVASPSPEVSLGPPRASFLTPPPLTPTMTILERLALPASHRAGGSALLDNEDLRP